MKVRDMKIAARLVAGMLLLSAPATAGQRTYKHDANGELRTRAARETHWSPDHALQAVVIYHKPHFIGEAESSVEIRAADGRLLVNEDYLSGGSHGGTVTGAA